ncbi:hypothetical protein FACS1894208_05580 [Clostridia bacterium]|nr:hypothetical protein FACS1894208_05580 [Clostridia bacterium]
MAAESRNFRSSVLGFDRGDVINYIETISREHREEAEAFHSAAEKLRNERDELKKQLEEYRLADGEVERAQSEARAEIAALKKQLEDIKAANENIAHAKLRVADMELMAYKRAQEIEAEALQNAEKVRVSLAKLIRDTKGKYAAARGEADSIAYKSLQEVTRLRGWFDDFPQLFAEVDAALETIVPPARAQSEKHD